MPMRTENYCEPPDASDASDAFSSIHPYKKVPRLCLENASDASAFTRVRARAVEGYMASRV
jgi:hypothetical protein